VERRIRNEFYGLNLKGISPGLEYQLGSGGKRLRPALCQWLATGLGAEPSTSLPFAVAIELLHNAFLIQDDIEDGDRFRRGRATLWVEQGIPTALNVADFLIAEAFRLVAEAGAENGPLSRDLHEIFTQTFRTTVEGQALDLYWRGRSSFTVEAYEEIIRKKTGRYLAVGWVGAARLAGRERAEANAFWEIGDELGPAFQIKDDLLDLTDGKGRGGEVGCDIREGKPSILYAHALAHPGLDSGQRARLVEIHARDREKTEPQEVAWVIALYDELGVLEVARREMRKRLDHGVRKIESLAFAPPPLARQFGELAQFLVDRKV
jgi:geranylgeranyl pyrophosphate synthase